MRGRALGLLALGGDCRSAIAAHAAGEGGNILLRAELLSPDGREVQAGEVGCATGGAPAELARQLLDRSSPMLRALFSA